MDPAVLRYHSDQFLNHSSRGLEATETYIQALVSLGVCERVGGELHGRASDGVIVNLGDITSTDGLRALGRYFTSNPLPENW